ncbi:hypothetical protein [Gulbenkiania mobilis]|uniref:hypothetical protein n=1 Tax=Gulbenkiania mobilis TaxID=397457 RepID=UPI00128F6E3F|nr:hypothetical protein [Gulbenkiania mobilis]
MAGIKDEAPSRRSPVYVDQARMLALLSEELIRARQARPTADMEDFTGTPEYHRLLIGAYACGFVCRDLAPMQQELDARELETVPFGTVRHWVHHLLRAERWADGYWSPIMNAVDDGRLAIVARRLGSGELIEPEVIEDAHA